MNMLPYAAIVLLIFLSAFFSSSEIAYAAANRLRLKNAAENGGVRERTALYIYQNYERALCSILIGNNLVNIASSSIATVIAVDLTGASGAALATLVMTVVILIFGEIVPKIVAQERADSFASAVSVPLRALMTVTRPVVFVVMKLLKLISGLWSDGEAASPFLTEDELMTMIETVTDEGVIKEEKGELLQSAIEFFDISAQEILTPRVDLQAIDIDAERGEIMDIIYRSNHSRLPVYQESLDNIIGVVYLDDFFRRLTDSPELPLRDAVTEPCFIHRSTKLPRLLSELKSRGIRLAVVVDDFGGTMGVVTVEDIMEELVGEIWDETDEVRRDIVQLSEGKYEVSGILSVYDLFDRLDTDSHDFDGHYNTVGGWAAEMLGGIPKPGDSFDYKDLRVTVMNTDELRVLKLLAEKLPQEE